MFGSEPGFLSIGITAAGWKKEGIILGEKDACMIAEMRRSREGIQDLTKVVGRGSRRQVEGFDLRMISDLRSTGKLENGK